MFNEILILFQNSDSLGDKHFRLRSGRPEFDPGQAAIFRDKNLSSDNIIHIGTLYGSKKTLLYKTRLDLLKPYRRG